MVALVHPSELQRLPQPLNVLMGDLPFANFDHAYPGPGFAHGSGEVCLLPP
jgi:hypothetical protein